jgi:hypothetical protein
MKPTERAEKIATIFGHQYGLGPHAREVLAGYLADAIEADRRDREAPGNLALELAKRAREMMEGGR